jgi:hypothetical protein
MDGIGLKLAFELLGLNLPFGFLQTQLFDLLLHLKVSNTWPNRLMYLDVRVDR